MIPDLCRIALAAAVLAQSTTSPQIGASRFALAAVDDPRGKALVDVGVDDFVVQEGSATREILDVRVADYPVVIVLDNVDASGADFPALRAAVVRLVERLGPRPVAVITISGEPKAVASFEVERTTLVERLEDLETATEEGQPLRGAALAGRMIQATGALFSTIVVATASREEAAAADAGAFLAPVIDSRAVVHVIFNSANAKREDATGAVLRGLASQTHGQFTAIYSSASYQPALDRIVARLTTELLIEYIVPAGSKPTDVKIGIRIPGARVRGLGVAPR